MIMIIIIQFWIEDFFNLGLIYHIIPHLQVLQKEILKTLIFHSPPYKLFLGNFSKLKSFYFQTIWTIGMNLDIKCWPLVLQHTSYASNMMDCLLSRIIPPKPVRFSKTLTFAGSDLYRTPSCNSCQRHFCCPFSVMQWFSLSVKPLLMHQECVF